MTGKDEPVELLKAPSNEAGAFVLVSTKIAESHDVICHPGA